MQKEKAPTIPERKGWQKIVTIRKNGTKRVQYIDDTPSMADESQAKACDVNEIVKTAIQMNGIQRFNRWLESQPTGGSYADLSGVKDLVSAFEQVERVSALFKQLPVEVRTACENDPRNFDSWINDPRNESMARDLGLLKELNPSSKGAAELVPESAAEKSPKLSKSPKSSKSSDEE